MPKKFSVYVVNTLSVDSRRKGALKTKDKYVSDRNVLKLSKKFLREFLC